MMHSAGSDPADIVQGKVINVNMALYTVDVYSSFDRKRYMDVPVSSPYMHYANGEGLSVIPEVGSVCYICTPGDSSGPFVLAFVMPHANVDTSTEDSPQGQRSKSTPTGGGDASYAGNRPKGKPGDVSLSTRDGNFVRLHRGGVLQIGASELAQRIYVPLGNLVTDISENYQHLNTGGAISWGIQDGPSEEKFPAQFLHTFRVFANDKFADIKLAMGRVFNPVPDYGSGTNNTDSVPCIMELAIAPKSFDAVTGDIKNNEPSVETILHFLFDRDGNMFLQVKGRVKLKCEKTFELNVTEAVTVTAGGDMNYTANGLATFTGKGGAHIKGKIVRIGPGKRPAASQGDLVTSFIMAMPCVIVTAAPFIPGTPNPCIISIGPPSLVPPMGIPGSITSGEPSVLLGG